MLAPGAVLEMRAVAVIGSGARLSVERHPVATKKAP